MYVYICVFKIGQHIFITYFGLKSLENSKINSQYQFGNGTVLDACAHPIFDFLPGGCLLTIGISYSFVHQTLCMYLSRSAASFGDARGSSGVSSARCSEDCFFLPFSFRFGSEQQRLKILKHMAKDSQVYSLLEMLNLFAPVNFYVSVTCKFCTVMV